MDKKSAKRDNPGMVIVRVLHPPGTYLSAVYGISDILDHGNRHYGTDFTVRYSGPDAAPLGSPGREGGTASYAVVPPFRFGGEPLDPGVIRELKAAVARGAVPAAICAGAFYLCAAGLADGREVTTHWNLAGLLGRTFPSVRVRPEATLIDGGDYLSCGGITSFQDLALHLLRLHAGREAALETARTFLLGPENRNQLQYAALSLGVDGGDPVVSRAQRFFLRRFRDPVGVADAAADCGVSARTLQRRFTAACGSGPAEYLRKARLERARVLLTETGVTVAEAALESGFSDAPSFSRLFRETFGLSPGAYRSAQGVNRRV